MGILGVFVLVSRVISLMIFIPPSPGFLHNILPPKPTQHRLFAPENPPNSHPFSGASLALKLQVEPRKKKPGWLGYIGDFTTQLYRDYNKPL